MTSIKSNATALQSFLQNCKKHPPMNSLQTTTTVLGLGLSVLIAVLLMREHLYLRHGLFWIAVAIAGILLGIWPGAIDHVAIWFGISYSPAGLFIATVVVLFVKYLYADMTQTRLERKLRRLNQRIAMFELTETTDTINRPKPTGKPNNSI
jgi:hypothetical protein